MPPIECTDELLDRWRAVYKRRPSEVRARWLFAPSDGAKHLDEVLRKHVQRPGERACLGLSAALVRSDPPLLAKTDPRNDSGSEFLVENRTRESAIRAVAFLPTTCDELSRIWCRSHGSHRLSMMAPQPKRGRRQGREAPRNEGSLDAQAERRLSGSRQASRAGSPRMRIPSYVNSAVGGVCARKQELSLRRRAIWVPAGLVPGAAERALIERGRSQHRPAVG